MFQNIQGSSVARIYLGYGAEKGIPRLERNFITLYIWLLMALLHCSLK
jgi:hypothetical protein